MCTLTILPGPEGYLAAMNRDERRDRPAAGPLQTSLAEGLPWVRPVDPVAGGTWIGLNAAGLLLALLNHYPDDLLPDPDAPSRGGLIPAVIGSWTVEEAVARLSRIDVLPYNPFRLVIVDPAGVVQEATWDRHRVQVVPRPAGPLFASSSGWQQEAVDHRRRIFEQELLASLSEDLEHQREALRRLHARQEPDQPPLGIAMEHPLALTRSTTEVEVNLDCSILRHREGFPDPSRWDELVEVALPRLV